LDQKRRAMLPKLEFLHEEYGFYLAGGTALALQIGHRTSVDFDFYSKKEFDNQKLLLSLQQNVSQITLIQNLPNTLIVEIPEEIEMSFFLYPYLLLEQPVKVESVYLASKEDIAAMKLIAIMQRGTQRDFIDLYFLMKEFSLEKIFCWAKEKFPPFSPYVALRALTNFHDADQDQPLNRLKLLIKTDWESVKKAIVKQVYQMKREQLG
jgi:hypothetical protein